MGQSEESVPQVTGEPEYGHSKGKWNCAYAQVQGYTCSGAGRTVVLGRLEMIGVGLVMVGMEIVRW